jgi:hypothetical protein
MQDLLLPKILMALGELENARLPADEINSSLALHPLVRGLLNPVLGAQMAFGIMARTSVLFVLDHQEFLDAIGSLENVPFVPGLPPLPYSRISVECMEDATWAMVDSSKTHSHDLELFTINETLRGRQWHVCLLLRKAISDEEQLDLLRYAQLHPHDPKMVKLIAEEYQPGLVFFQVNDDGSVIEYQRGERGPSLPADEIRNAADLDLVLSSLVERPDDVMDVVVLPPDDLRAISARSIPIEFAHLVNARGVTVEPLGVDRAQRRRFERKKAVHPQVYFVYIDDAVVPSEPGPGDREYHCRWMVRGHWRHYQSGDAVWIRPYIKGPAGAPWKGRPIYVLEGDAA